MAIDWKERSEIIKNLVSTAAVVVGGLWVLYQWDTVFPKTRADVQAAAASVRTDVSGAFNVQLDMNDDGSPPPFREDAAAADPGDLQAYCMSHPGAVLVQSTPVFGQLMLKSASGIPVRAEVEQVAVSTAPISSPVIHPPAGQTPSIAPMTITDVATLTDDRMFIGGLRANRVEKGQEVQVAVMFDVKVPVQCAHLERLVLFKAQVALTAIDPAKDRPIGPPVPKIFVTTCQLNPRTAPACNISGIEARGQ
ncbi:hypothetical protein [Allosphingosinicella deserti]|uniref:Uncharacterized protein n=1 Tax=Allosphingosinicella deserti TaxID=2116704 RepID=A0A2P7QLN7_9SPHN|nr:hypothetical protein [Sphingomonas deserti]PSJ38865.1 hypothetical protein C7I55_16185 [Sphingomonas deserti]